MSPPGRAACWWRGPCGGTNIVVKQSSASLRSRCIPRCEERPKGLENNCHRKSNGYRSFVVEFCSSHLVYGALLPSLSTSCFPIGHHGSRKWIKMGLGLRVDNPRITSLYVGPTPNDRSWGHSHFSLSVKINPSLTSDVRVRVRVGIANVDVAE